MKNLTSGLGRRSLVLLSLVGTTTFFSCQKDVSSIEETETAVTAPTTDEVAADAPVDVIMDPSAEIPADVTADPSDERSAPAMTADNSAARTGLIFEQTSESSSALSLALNSLTQWNSLAKCCSYSIGRNSSYKRAGSYSFRYELNKYDKDVAGSKRTEANRYSGSEPVVKVERWYGMSYYLGSDYVTDKAPEIVTQWQSPKGVQPPLAIWTYNGHWMVARSYGSTSIKTTTTDIGAYTKGAWTDIVVHVKWSTSSDGLIEVWKNGSKVYTYAGSNTYSGQSKGNYLKTGIYKWPWKTGTYSSNTTKRVAYIDEVRIGTSSAGYTNVKPG